MENLSRIYSQFATELRFEDLPPEVVLQAKKSILDLIGVALAGSVTELGGIVFNYFSEIGGKPEATVIGKNGKAPALHAAMMNGIFAHALELDDGQRWSGVHPGSPIIPAALAAAELSRAPGRSLIVGTIVGYEIAIRIGKAINPSHIERGFHPTGTVGPFGAAAAAGMILGLDSEKMIQAFGLAGLHGAGLLQVVDEGGMAKPVHPGKAASGGLFSAQMALNGVKAPERILEGKKGFLKAMSDKIDTESLVEGLGSRFEICEAYFKLHASCRHTHPVIDALLEILREKRLDPNRIERIRIETYPIALQFCGHGLDERSLHPSDAKFSIPYSLALAAFNGGCGIDVFTQGELARPEVQRLAQRVEMATSKKWGSLYPEKRGATVSLEIDGNMHQCDIGHARGDPENPISMDELYEKFHVNAAQAISSERARQLMERIMGLDHVSRSAITELLSENSVD